MTSQDAAPDGAPTTRRLLLLALPALIIGVASALALWVVDAVSHVLQTAVWDTIPGAFGFATDAWWWTLGVLTITGLMVGLVVWLVPGHGGHDSATVELVSPVLPLRTLPSVALVSILGLAGGVSLGPESPIIAINAGLAVALLARFLPAVPADLTFTMAASGTIGALFGTPVAAALVFTGIVAAIRGGGSLWDKLFLPLVSAGAGAYTMRALGGEPLTIGLPAYDDPQPVDVLLGVAIAAVAAVFAIAGALAFPHVHRLFHGLKHPVLYITLGGAALGVLAIIGGPITMFKGLSQMVELVDNRAEYAVGALVVIVVVKLVALVVAASSGFRGGRIFPAVFIGAAMGVLANALIPSMPISLAVGCGVLGVVLVVSRDGWISLFIATMIAGDLTVLPILVIIVLPTWLITRSAPEMIVHPVPEPDGVEEPTR